MAREDPERKDSAKRRRGVRGIRIWKGGLEPCFGQKGRAAKFRQRYCEYSDSRIVQNLRYSKCTFATSLSECWCQFNRSRMPLPRRSAAGVFCAMRAGMRRPLAAVALAALACCLDVSAGASSHDVHEAAAIAGVRGEPPLAQRSRPPCAGLHRRIIIGVSARTPWQMHARRGSAGATPSAHSPHPARLRSRDRALQ